MQTSPLISVLMPSRKRSELALASVKSLGKDPRIETLLIIDEDEDIEAYERLLPYIDGLYVSPQRYGYIGLQNYYNYLARHAAGGWLMVWNDDAFMRTPDWVDKIQTATESLGDVPRVLTIYHPTDNLFPLISRCWYEITNHYSLSPHNDSWVQQIGQQLDIQLYVPDIKIEHLQHSLRDNLQIELGAIRDESSALHRSPEMEAARELEATKIRRWINKHERVQL